MSSQVPSQKPVGPRLRALMASHDLRAEDVASQLGVSHSTVLRWMRGSNQPTQRAARQLGRLFAVEWDSFYEEREAA